MKDASPTKVTLVYSRAIDPAPHKVAEALSQNGYKVKLLVWDRGKMGKVKNSNAYTTCRFGFGAPYDKFTVLFYLPIWWGYEFLFLLRDDSDIVHACNLDTLLPAIVVKLIKRAKLCYTVYDFYANNLPDGHPRLIRKLIRSIVASIEKFGIRFAEVLFLADECRYEEVKGAQIKNLFYIYNSPPDYFDAERRPKPRARKEIIILYVGLIHKSRGLEYMIKAVEGLDNVRLMLAGTGADKELVEKSACRCQKIQYIGWIPSYEGVIKKTLDADVIFRFGDPKIPKSKYESPNKLFEAMMCGKPIIVNAEMAASRIVQRENCGLIVPYGDVTAIKEALLRLKNNPKLCRLLGENGRKAYQARYSWDIMKGRLINAYDELATSV